MELKDFISITDGFPKPGISFKDISPLLADPRAFKEAIHQLAEQTQELAPNIILGPEARGFVVGAPLALELGVGFVMARKASKLPGELVRCDYGLEYGTDSLSVEKALIRPGCRVVIADDLMATGGTAQALVKLVRECGAIPAGVVALVHLTDFDGQREFDPVPFRGLIKFNR